MKCLVLPCCNNNHEVIAVFHVVVPTECTDEQVKRAGKVAGISRKGKSLMKVFHRVGRKHAV
jgi:hypothetical protein